MKISPQSSTALSAMFTKARLESGMSRRVITKRAARRLQKYSEQPGVTTVERKLWRSTPLNWQQLVRLEECPSNPTSDDRRRTYLLAFALALDLDLTQVNRYAGGVPTVPPWREDS